MLDHMILTVSKVERSLAFYEAALKPLNIQFFLPFKAPGTTMEVSMPQRVSSRAETTTRASMAAFAAK
jgi:hypothetical protein